jgi:membrane-bound serine protease (ClpP class)
MDAAVTIALVGIGLLVAELLLSTGGVLAALGALGLVAAGVLALESNSGAADYVGPALIALGLLSLVAFYFVTRKVIEAHQDGSVRTGSEELIGALAEVRSTLDPEGQVWIEGALWGARAPGGAGPVSPGDRVRVEAIEGLTLVVHPETPAPSPANGGASRWQQYSES